MSAIRAYPTNITPADPTAPTAQPVRAASPAHLQPTPTATTDPTALADAYHALDYTDPASLYAFFHSLPPHLAAALDHLDTLDPDDHATQDADHAFAQLLAQELYTATSDKKSAASATPQPTITPAVVGAMPASPAGSPSRTPPTLRAHIEKSAESATPTPITTATPPPTTTATATTTADTTGIHATAPVLRPLMAEAATTPVLRPLMAESAESAESARTPHIPHAPHPDRIPLRDQAFALHCHGLRAPAISQQLGVPQRTIRAWIAAIQDEIRADSLHTYTNQLTTALEGLRQLLAAAWAGYETDAALHHSLIAQAFPTTPHEKSAESATPHPLPDAGRGPGGEVRPPRIPCRPDAYLRVALNVQRQIIRLLGLDRPQRTPSPSSSQNQKSAESATPSPARVGGLRGGTPSRRGFNRQPALTHRERRRLLHATLPSPSLAGKGPGVRSAT
ncbi:MAG: hypothetical protein OJF49_002391 [Ktedonobacterales bacterium]|jgi:hypothetical protein|nr:MAG: hypothetical protein OJF49_002391 [Ktedonobacterales bacterium]